MTHLFNRRNRVAVFTVFTKVSSLMYWYSLSVFTSSMHLLINNRNLVRVYHQSVVHQVKTMEFEIIFCGK